MSSLSDCEHCWETPCCCPDGAGWRKYSLQKLQEIEASIAAARSPLRMIQEGCIEVQDRAGRVLAPVQLRTEKRDEGEVLIVVVET